MQLLQTQGASMTVSQIILALLTIFFLYVAPRSWYRMDLPVEGEAPIFLSRLLAIAYLYQASVCIAAQFMEPSARSLLTLLIVVWHLPELFILPKIPFARIAHGSVVLLALLSAFLAITEIAG